MSIIQYISDKIKQWNSPGVNFPLANDGVEGPSVTLLFAYVGFIATLLSLIYLHFNPDKLSPTIMSTVVWSIALLIYRMRRLDRVKFDLDEKSFELDAEDDETIKPNSKDEKDAK